MAYAFGRGISLFDTAQFYGTYHYVRRALEIMAEEGKGRPKICSKSLCADYAGMQAAVEEALRETGLEKLDIFLLHQMTPGDLEARAGAWQCLKDMKKQGLVDKIGLSTHHVDLVEQASEIKELDVVFALYNYAGLGIRRGDGPGTAAEMRSALRLCREKGKYIMGMKIFGGGNLTTDYQKAARHAFFACGDLFDTLVIGFTEEREIDELFSLLAGSLPPDYNPPVAGKRLRVDREDCMGCGSCVRICASGAMHYSPVDGLAEIDYDKCVSCSYCAIACPERAIVFW